MKHIYAFESSGLVKVGYTKNIKGRISDIESASGRKVNRFHDFGLFSDFSSAEAKAHIAVSDYHEMGEWFKIDFDYCVELVSKELTIFNDIKPVSDRGFSSVDGGIETVFRSSDGYFLCLSDLLSSVNMARLNEGKPCIQLSSFLKSAAVNEYLEAASDIWCIPVSELITTTGKGKNTKRHCHVSVALLFCEQASPKIHAMIHKYFLDGKFSAIKEVGATEFSKLNAAIDEHLSLNGDEKKKGVFIQTAKLMRQKILGEGAVTADWNSATVEQTHKRYDMENKISDMLRLGVVNNYDHLKQLIGKM